MIQCKSGSLKMLLIIWMVTVINFAKSQFNDIDHQKGYTYLPPVQNHNVKQDLISANYLAQSANPLILDNPLVTALLLSALLNVPNTSKHFGQSHPDHLPVNPYITLLLSQYGRYLPVHALGTKGLYYYAAANNYHNNKPFGSYKVYEDAK